MRRWETLDELEWLRECLGSPVQLLGRRLRPPPPPGPWEPLIDLYETDTEVVIRADVPGLDPKSLTISIEEGNVLLRGEARPEHEEQGRIYRRRELHSGPFQAVVTVPSPVVPESISVKIEGGIVEIRMTKVRDTTRE